MRRALRVLAVVVILQAAALFVWNGPLLDGGPMLLIAHRGDTSVAPENTREAILAALARDDLNGVEMDVLRSSKGTWWVFHDPEIERLIGSTGRFAELSDAEIAELPIVGGIGYRAEYGTGYRAPRLSDLMPELEAYDGVLIFDVKELSAEAHADLAATVAHLARPMVICRNVAGARAVKEVADIPTLALTTAGSDEAVDYRLADAGLEVTSPIATLGQSVAAFVHQDFGDTDGWRERADRWGVRLYIAPT